MISLEHPGNPSRSTNSAGEGQPAIALHQAGLRCRPVLHWPVIRSSGRHLPTRGPASAFGQSLISQLFYYVASIKKKKRAPSHYCLPQSINTKLQKTQLPGYGNWQVFIWPGLQFLKTKLLWITYGTNYCVYQRQGSIFRGKAKVRCVFKTDSPPNCHKGEKNSIPTLKTMMESSTDWLSCQHSDSRTACCLRLRGAKWGTYLGYKI